MFRNTLICLVSSALLMVLTGCSVNRSNSICPPTNPDNNPPVYQCEDNVSKHTNLGSWKMEFDPNSQKVLIRKTENNIQHLNVRPYLPDPSITFISYDTNTKTYELEVTISNPYSITAFDVRLIVYSDDYGERLINPDAWTSLYDKPGNRAINPFKAYAKNNPNRTFHGNSSNTERLLIYVPDGFPPVDFAIDASLQHNCLDPYKIENIKQGQLTSITGSKTTLKVDIGDWQDNVNSVVLWCPSIFEQQSVDLARTSGYQWETEIRNEKAVPPGLYKACIVATSSDLPSLPLYRFFKIRVMEKFISEINREGSFMLHCGNLSHISIQKNYAFVAGRDEMIIADISNPLEIRGISTIDLPSSITSLAVEGDYAYFTFADNFYYGGFGIVDVSDVFNPKNISLLILGDARYVYIDGAYAYVVFVGYPIKIIDISDPYAPSIVSNFGDRDYRRILIHENFGYLIDAHDYLSIVDVSNPLEPTLLSNTQIDQGRGLDMAIKGNYLFVTGTDLFVVVDVSNPSNPNVVYININLNYSLSYIELINNTLYLLSAHGAILYVLDVSNPTNPVELAAKQIYEFPLLYLNDIKVVDKYLFLACISYCGIGVFDVENPQDIVAVEQYSGVNFQKIAVKDDYVFVADHDYSHAHLTVVSIKEPKKPKIIYSSPKLVWVVDIAIAGNYLYFASSGYIIIYDISNPENPVEMSYLNVNNEPYKIIIEGNRLYLKRGHIQGLMIFDISSPTQPELLVDRDFPEGIGDYDVKGNYLFTSATGYLRIYDVSDPASITKTGELAINKAYRISVKDNYAIVTINQDETYKIIDVSDPTNPILIASIEEPYRIENMGIEGNYVCFGLIDIYGTTLIHLVDIHNINNPISIGLEEVGNWTVTDIEIYDQYIFSSHWESGFYICKLS